MMQDECGMDLFPMDEDNHFIDILKVFDLSHNVDKMIDIDTKEAAESGEKAAKISDQFHDFYRGSLI